MSARRLTHTSAGHNRSPLPNPVPPGAGGEMALTLGSPQPLIGDVAAELSTLKMDGFHRRIGGFPRTPQILSPSRNAQHPAAAGHHLLPGISGAGVEDFGVRQTGSFIQPPNRFALGIAARVAGGGHHHAN